MQLKKKNKKKKHYYYLIVHKSDFHLQNIKYGIKRIYYGENKYNTSAVH